MPCSARKARILLKKGEAHVVRTNPFFVIQLNISTGEQVRPSIRRQRYSIQPHDLVIVKGKKYAVKGSFNLGKWISCSDDLNKVNFSISKIDKVFHTGSVYIA